MFRFGQADSRGKGADKRTPGQIHTGTLVELPGADAVGLAIALEAKRDEEWAELERGLNRFDEVAKILDDSKALAPSDVYEN